MATPKLQTSAFESRHSLEFSGVESKFHRPTVMEPSFDLIVVNSKSFTQLSQTARFTEHSKNPVVALVSMLLDYCGPFAIKWKSIRNTIAACATGVVTVTVNTINAFTEWHMTHGVEKPFKGSHSRTQPYSTASIPTKITDVWIFTTINRATPSCVRSGVTNPVSGLTICPKVIKVFLETTAGLNVSTYKISIDNCLYRAAFTLAHACCPLSHSISWSVLDNFKPSKCSSNQRFFSRHNIRSNVVFSGTRGLQPTECCELYG